MNKIARHLTNAALAALLISGSISGAFTVSIVNNSDTEQKIFAEVLTENGEREYAQAKGVILGSGERKCFYVAGTLEKIRGLFACPASLCKDWEWKNKARSYNYMPITAELAPPQERAMEFEITENPPRFVARYDISPTGKRFDCTTLGSWINYANLSERIPR